MFCRSLVVSPNSLNQARFPPHQLCASFFCFLFILLLLFSEYIYRWYGCYFCSSLFPNGFLLCDHGLDLWDRLMCEFNQSINQSICDKSIRACVSIFCWVLYSSHMPRNGCQSPSQSMFSAHALCMPVKWTVVWYFPLDMYKWRCSTDIMSTKSTQKEVSSAVYLFWPSLRV